MTTQDERASSAATSKPASRAAQRLRARSTGAGAPLRGADDRLGTFALTVVLYTTIPKGFFPEEDLGQMRVSTEASEDISSSGHAGAAGPGGAAIQADPNVQDVTSFTGRRQQRPHVPGAQAARRARQDAAGAGAPAQGHAQDRRHQRSIWRRCRTCSWAAARARAATSTRCKASVGRAQAGPTSSMERMRADPMFRDVTSDTQNKGLQATSTSTATRPTCWACRWRRAHRAVRRLRRAPGVDHLLDRGQLLRDPGGGQRRPPVRGRAVAPVGAQQDRQLVQLSSLRHRQAHGRPDRRQPPGPAAGDHAVVQPGAGRAAGRRHRGDRRRWAAT
jgi:hypothetical protein